MIRICHGTSFGQRSRSSITSVNGIPVYIVRGPLGPEESEEFDLNAFAQGGHDSRFGWNEVTHFKADGTISRFVGNLAARDSSLRPQSGIAVTNAGYAEASGIYVPSGTTCAYTFASGKNLIVRTQNHDTDPNLIRYGTVQFAVSVQRVDDAKAKKYGWRYKAYESSSSTSFGWPASLPISYGGDDDDPESLRFQEIAALASAWVAYVEGLSDSQVPARSARMVDMVYEPGNIGPSVPSRRILDFVRYERTQFMQSSNSQAESVTPEMHASAFDSVQKFDGNLLAFISELPSFGTTGIRSILDLISASPSKASAASFWLSNRYGDRLSFKDAKELFQGFDRSFLNVTTTRYIFGRSRASTHFRDGYWDFDISCACMAAVRPNDSNALMRAIRTAYEWDFYPSLGNVWDMIPMSFVVDWFVNVSDIFDSVDRMVQARYYDVLRVLQSVKAVTRSPLFPGVEYSYYSRHFRSSLSLGVSSVELGLPSAINIIDGLALLAM
jgi:hypothetical protein